jgi:outer membrane protein assembly factor BamB
MLRERLTTFLVLLAVMGALQGCSKDWPAFRHNVLRTANQLHNSRLADPAKVSTLAVVWNFQPPGAAGFRASPIVYKKRVYIGNGNGFFYALKQTTVASCGSTPLPAELPWTRSSTAIPRAGE